MRTSEINRCTQETKIALSLNLDGEGRADIDTGCGFLNHMLELFAAHGGFDLMVRCSGDTDVDYHHTVEDAGIALGCAMAQALGDKKGITRYGSIILPMDEALILAAADISGRGGCFAALDIPTQRVGDFDTELCAEFFTAFAREAGITLHLRQISGSNSHHVIEGVFKAAARCLARAAAIDAKNAGRLPSTKGVL